MERFSFALNYGGHYCWIYWSRWLSWSFKTWEIYWEISYFYEISFICDSVLSLKTFNALSLFFFILSVLTVVYCGDFFSGHLLICALPSVCLCLFSVWGWCLLRYVEDMVYAIDLLFSFNCASNLNVWSFHCFSYLLYVLFLCFEFFIFFVHFLYILYFIIKPCLIFCFFSWFILL